MDYEALLVAAGNREALFLADGMHKTAPGHRLLADALLPVVAELWLSGRAVAAAAAGEAR